ncbi:MAG TPA: DEAD/DEAH box helicase [Thiotrichales bacterium]|nr:MAG: helicase [Thiotrichales bacterium 17-46-47]HQT01964.1 DEAD/DEAH box helicase [Thiotrichales bacterium]HQT04094.1 DEAD/DEAH box helicase [Thiotrichales bacterium]
MNQLFAPGARVEIRDAEWVVRRVDATSDQHYQLTCEGISELVRGKSAIFLTALEDDIRILDPKTTELVQDLSSGFAQSLLYIESQLRQSTPNDDRIHIADQAAMDLVPYQLDPTLQALQQPRQRILIADAVGLGKTLEAGILVTELIQRGRGKRILVLTLKSMMTQFQKEFWNRFSIPLTRLDSIGLQRVRGRIPSNHNPFYYYDKTIISIDTLKQDNEFKRYLETAYWDIIVIDEAHNVADRGTSSKRTELAQLLASRSDTLIMLSATPHDGKAKSFASLMNMLDPTAISDPENYIKEDFSNKGLVVRRFKKDIKDQVKDEFKERSVHAIKHPATAAEEAVYRVLLDVPFTISGQYDKQKQAHLVRIGLQKALFSSPAACLVSVEQRIKTLQKDADKSAVQIEIDHLKALTQQLQQVDNAQWSKYQAFLTLVQSNGFNWSKTDTDDRLVIFSERIETLRYLEAHLSKDLKLKDNQITQLHGGMSDIEQQAIVEAFGKRESPLRVLLCSDVASEGINLHYLSHRLVHFDLPWSLMVFQQRNGRVDRYGQEQNPEIYYLITESQNETIRGDTRILEILQQKDDQAYQNIGDPATFMGVFDVDLEEQITTEAMVTGMDASVFDQQYNAQQDGTEGDDLMALFMQCVTSATENTVDTPDVEASSENNVPRLSLFASDYAFAKASLTYLAQLNPLQVRFNDERGVITLTAPDDLHDKFKHYPSEIYPELGAFELTVDKQHYLQEVKRARNDDNAWPKQHYLWAKHPVMEWLQERMLGNTGRHQALIMGLNNQLVTDEAIFIVSALIPNRKAHPVIWSWYAVHTQGNAVTRITPLADTLSQLNLINQPNSHQPVNLALLNGLKPAVIDRVKDTVLKEKAQFDALMMPKLTEQLQSLLHLQDKQQQQLELALEKKLESVRESERQRKTKRIAQVFSDYQRWIQETWQTEPQPYIQLVAVVARAQDSAGQ